MDTTFVLVVGAIFLVVPANCLSVSPAENGAASEHLEASKATSDVDVNLRKWVEEFRANMTKPNTAMGLPTLDGLDIDNFPLKFIVNCFINSGVLDPLLVLGLSAFTIDRLHFDVSGLQISFLFTYANDIEAAGANYYSINLMEGSTPAESCLLTFVASNVVLVGDVTLATNSSGKKNIYVKSSSLQSFFGNVTIVVDNLGSSELSKVSTVILNNVLQNKVDSFVQYFLDAARDWAVSFANKRLENTTLADLLKALEG